MKQSPHRIKHKRRKAVRKAQTQEEVQTEEKKITPKQKKDYEKRNLLTTDKKRKTKESRLKGHKSKRTSTKEVTFETEPEHIHHEGEYWITRTKRKIVDSTARFTKKLLHGAKRFVKKFNKK